MFCWTNFLNNSDYFHVSLTTNKYLGLFTINNKSYENLRTSWIYWTAFNVTYATRACLHAKSLQSCPTLCYPMDCSPPGSSGHADSPGKCKILEWDVRPSSRGSSQPRDQTHVSYNYLHWPKGSLPLTPPGKPNKWHGLASQSCLALWDPMNYSPPGSSIHGILQARILEWVAVPFSKYMA